VDVKAILSDLAMQILPNKASRFNINRGDLWEVALHGFKRQSYDPTYTMLVKFTDDYIVNEGGIDAGGPTREFLQLLMCHIKGHSLLEGKRMRNFSDVTVQASNISSIDPTLEDIVMFATGLKMIRPLGFEPRPTIKFLHDNSLFPTANTCSNTLCLPLHSSYYSFNFHISFGILNSPGFGLY
ncbi:G2E3 ligase, partial [Polypterus senegalus]|nr:G2E3 ligase [Polypterus senegalus]